MSEYTNRDFFVFDPIDLMRERTEMVYEVQPPSSTIWPWRDLLVHMLWNLQGIKQGRNIYKQRAFKNYNQAWKDAADRVREL